MKKIVKYIKHTLLLLIALQILNTGLFAQDFPVVNHQENIINSVTEYIAEVLLNKADVFPENHRHQHQHHTKQSHSLILKVQQYVLFKHTPHTTIFAYKEQTQKNKYALDKHFSLNKMCFDITPPPPKV